MEKYFAIQVLNASGCSFIHPYNAEKRLFQHGLIKNAILFDSTDNAEAFLIGSTLLSEYECLSIVPVYTKK